MLLRKAPGILPETTNAGLRGFALATLVVLVSCGDGGVDPDPELTGLVNLAFIGDQGWEPSGQYDGPRAVLRLIRQEGVDAVLHQGDFDYGQDPQGWMAMIDEELGQDFPYFASVGNHEMDGPAWGEPGGYRDLLEDRATRLGYTWTGTYGEQASLSFEGIRVLLGAPGIFAGVDNTTYASYFAGELATDTATWRICSWHKNQQEMQVGGKGDEVGYEVYEACREGGAIIATGHEHSYSRTHLLSDVSAQVVASVSDTLEVSHGRTFVFVSGLGGKSIRTQLRDGDWWASISTATQGARYGALFAAFNVDGDPTLAHFYFKDVAGQIVDEFWVRSRVSG